jgi:hypothetical protein
MKKIINSIIALILLCFTITSCDNMHSKHQEFLDRGSNVYLGIPIILEANSGLERVQLVWGNFPDPRTTETRIFWNNREDSIVVPIDRTNPIMEKIVPLPAGMYIIEMVNASETGVRSLWSDPVPVESLGDWLGATLHNRIATVASVTPELVLQWNVVEGVEYTHINYVNRAGESVTAVLTGSETTLTLNDFVPGGNFTHYSLFLMQGSIDLIPSHPATGTFPQLPNREVSVVSVAHDQLVSEWTLLPGVVSTHISYINRNGEPITVVLGGDVTTLTVTDFVTGGEFTHYSLFVLQGATDEIASNPATATFPSSVRLSRVGWQVIAFTSQNNTGQWAAGNIIRDDVANTWGWHSLWANSGNDTVLPQVIDIDIQQPSVIVGIEVGLRADVSNAYLYLSMDGTVWTRVGSVGAPTGATTNFPGLVQTVVVESVEARFVRFSMTESWRNTEGSLWNIFLDGSI